MSSQHKIKQCIGYAAEYHRDLVDWIRLCAKCHKAYDMGRIKL